MKYAIISDIHGNLEAFQSVINAIAAERLDEVVCLGDIVGYGANPSECIDLVLERASLCVAGNHDWGVAGKTNLNYFNRAARAAIEWTASQITAGYVQFLANLPLLAGNRFFTTAHATPLNPEDWNYIFTAQEARLNLHALEHPLCFVGHSHVPTVFCLDQSGVVSYATSFAEVPISKGDRYLINVGSIGQPRDNDPRAAYGILDTDNQTVTLQRIPYDIAAAQRKIIAAGLPPVLAERIALGW